MTAVTSYGDCGPVGSPGQETWEVSGGASGTIQVAFAGSGQSFTATATYTTTGTVLAVTTTCGQLGGGSGSYTATSNSLVFGGTTTGSDGGSCTVVETLTLQ